MDNSQAGILEEMMDDTLAMDEDEELEEEADAEVDKVLFDLTNGKLGQAGSVQTELPVGAPSPFLKVWPEIDCYGYVANRTGNAGGRRDRKSDGTVPSPIEWPAEWLAVRGRLLSSQMVVLALSSHLSYSSLALYS